MELSRRDALKLAGAASLSGALFSPHMWVSGQETGNAIRMAINVSDIANLNPHFATTTQDRAIVDMVFNGLVRFTPGTSTDFEPDLATEMPTPTENEDGTQTWSFTLRDDVTVHATEGVNAAPLTVEDVLFSFETAANPDTSAYSGDYADWTFAIGDDGTFQITLPAPISETLFLPKVANYSGGYIVPQAPFEALGADGFVTNPVGTGPFSFTSHTPQNNVTLTKHAEFYRGEPQLDSVEIRFIADPTSRELAIQSRDVNVVNGLPEAAWVDRMNELDGIVADVFGVGEVSWVNLDTTHEILQDIKVREAIMLAIDRNNHIALHGEPVAMPVYSVVPADLMPGGLTAEEAEEAGADLASDLDRARELLAEAGYAEGFELDLVSSEQDSYRSNYEVLAEELRQIGIQVTLEVVQHAAMHELIREGRNAIVIYTAYRPTADTYLTQFFTTDGGVTNFSKFTVDDLRDSARGETDAEAQAQIWRDAAIEIQTNFAAKGIMYINQVYARLETVDYGHELVAVPSLYPGINETTSVSSD